MKKIKLFILLLTIISSKFINAQKNNANIGAFEALTGKTLYQLTNSYILKYQFHEKQVIDKEMRSLSLKVKKTNNDAIKIDWVFLKAMVEISRDKPFENTKTLDDYLFF